MPKTKIYVAVLIALTVIFSSVLIVRFMTVKDTDAVMDHYSEKTRIEILESWGDTSDKSAVLTEVINAYLDSSPDIFVSNIALDGEAFYMRLQTDFASANESDIIITTPDRNMKRLYRAGKLASLNDAFAADVDWKNKIRGDALTLAMDNGNIFGIPTDIDYIALYANLDLFDYVGIEVPETLSQLKAAIPVFKNNGITPIAFSANDKDILLYQAIVSSLAGREELENAIAGTGSRDCYVHALQILKDLYSLGAFSQNCSSATQLEAQEMFLSANAAMLVENASFAGVVDRHTASGAAFDIFAFPSLNETRYPSLPNLPGDDSSRPPYKLIPYGAGSSTFFVSRNAYENKNEAVLTLLKF